VFKELQHRFDHLANLREEIASRISLNLAAHHQQIEQQVQFYRKLLRQRQELQSGQAIKKMKLQMAKRSFAQDNLKLILRRQRVMKANC